ncbi:hypothetical protein SUGI_1172570 [Cryptomeria japonica]|uniref:uncharacterized protein LOC131068282 n=1 Tax=Cryptomeria japonica TaxID=3369 RepID=UPI0024146E4F|nr:uncharacterized protein LOC131068282 [Cryptomeria japonica]GLJ54586.1 hypothetical protein SUGI_1172570 [Cryptomeria japonica]
MAEKGKGCSEVYNIAHKLDSREIGKRLASTNAHPQIKFRNFQLQEEFDTNQPSKIVEILAARSIIFALTQSGHCAAFDRHTNKRLCYLNLNPREQIRKLHYNKKNNYLITISMLPIDSQPDASHGFSMKCRTTPLEYIRRAQPDVGFTFFECEKLTCTGFVMFDSINGKGITFSGQDHIYKVFDLKNYTHLYSISAKEIEEIKISSDQLLLVSKRTACGSHLPLKILSIEDGKVLKSFHHAVLPNKTVHFVELCHDKIFVKQENECLQMVDVQSEKMIELRNQELEKSSTFIFLNEKRLFLTFHSGIVFVWSLQGDLVASYRNHLLRNFPRCTVQLIHNEELLLSYNKIRKSDKTNCSINIINSLTGNCCATIGGDDPDVGTSCRNQSNLSLIQNTFQDALDNVTALFYDKETNEVYTGNKRGFVHVWSN